MSRSRRKVSYYGDKKKRQSKRQANKKVRHLSVYAELSNGNKWKKLYCSWNICDWYVIRFYHEFINGTVDKKCYLKGIRK